MDKQDEQDEQDENPKAVRHSVSCNNDNPVSAAPRNVAPNLPITRYQMNPTPKLLKNRGL